MFTGIITDIGTVSDVLPGGNARVTIVTHYDMARVALGDSIACSGVCLTVVEKGSSWFAAEVSPETRACTTAELWKKGTRVNLEQALRMGDALGGHMVSGHVDGLAEVIEVQAANGAHVLTLEAPAALARFIAEKGSVTLDGVSLTVNAVQGVRFTVNIIPHTLQHTTLGDVAKGATLNLEVDMLARYAERLKTTNGTAMPSVGKWVEKALSEEFEVFIPAWFLAGIKSNEDKSIMLQHIVEDIARAARPYFGNIDAYLSEREQVVLAQKYYDIYINNMTRN